MNKWMAAGCAALLLAAWGAGRARAVAYRDPVPQLDAQEMAAGVGLDEDRQTAFLEYGVSDRGQLHVLLGTLDFGRADGVEVGAGYRHGLESEVKVGREPVRLAVLGIARYGQVEAGGEDFGFTQIDLAFGGDSPVQDTLRLYGLAVFRRVDASEDIDRGDSSESDVGLVAGAELDPAEALLLGAELHGGLEETVALYVEYRF